jgi:phospholipid/cholesterol/gamma-HCH transport system permease protein
MISNIGKYFMTLSRIFRRPDKTKVFINRVLKEYEMIGINSIPIVIILSVFMGAVIALQTAANMDSPLLPKYTIGFITRQSTILEFSPTILSLILAGKVGSNIASEIGTMKVTEQIDALEIMGVNSLNYLVGPKIVAAVLSFPVLICFSMALSLFGGWFATVQSGLASSNEYVFGIQAFFKSGDIVYGLTKTVFFAFLISSVSSFYGYHTSGGSLEVGKSSTKGVVTSMVCILVANLLLTQLFLV